MLLLLPDFGSARTYLAFFGSLTGEFIVIIGYFVVTSWPYKDWADLRQKLISKFFEKLYDGLLTKIIGASVSSIMAGGFVSLFVNVGYVPPYDAREREYIRKNLEEEVARWKAGQQAKDAEQRAQQQAKPEPLPPSSPAAPSASTPPANGDKLCMDGRITGWDSGVLDGASLATCQQGRFAAFVCVSGWPYLVTAGPARTTQVRFYSRDGRDRSSLDDTLQPRDEAGFAVSNLSPETFSYFMEGMAARLTMPGRTIRVDLSGVKRAASQSLAACMTDQRYTW